MIVRGHVVHVVKQLVGHAVVAGIHHNKDIVAAHGLLDQTLGITALEAGAVAGDDKGLLVNAGVLGPTDQVLVDQAGKLLGTGAGDQPHVCHTGLLEKRLGGNFNGHNHNSLLLLSNPNDLRTKAHIYLYFITFCVLCHIHLLHKTIFCALHICFAFFKKRLCVFDKKAAISLRSRKNPPIFREKYYFSM